MDISRTVSIRAITSLFVANNDDATVEPRINRDSPIDLSLKSFIVQEYATFDIATCDIALTLKKENYEDE